MLKCCKNCNGIYLRFKGNRLAIFMEFSQTAEQNHTKKIEEYFIFPFISEVPTAA